MNTLIGTGIILAMYAGGEYQPLAFGRKASFTAKRDMVEVASTTDGQSKEYIPGRKTFTMQCSSLMSNDIRTLQQAYDNGTVLTIAFQDKHSVRNMQRQYAGKTTISNLKATGNIHEMATLDITLQGTLSLSYTAAANAALYDKDLKALYDSAGKALFTFID